jgi:hypothetical protein
MARRSPAPDPRQLQLFSAAPRRSEAELFAALDRLLRGRLASLALTDTRSRILSVRPAGPDDPRLALRLHRCFLEAPAEALAAVAAWVGAGRWSPRGRQALAELRGHFERLRGALPEATRRAGRAAALRPVGRTLDLRQVRDELNERFFGGRLEVEISWGRGAGAGGCGERRMGGRRRARRVSLQLGSFVHERRLIRIHPALDGPRVPRYVVESIVYHELLHADLPPVEHRGRRLVHTAEFRRRERLFPDHARAERWIGRHLPELLRHR